MTLASNDLSQYLPRPRLTPVQPRVRIDQALGGAQVTLLVAATGYGKTTAALAHWDNQPGPKAWCSLDSHTHVRPALIGAIGKAWGLADAGVASSDLFDFPALLAKLPAAVGGLLVIDNWNKGVSAGDELVEIFAHLIDRLPVQCRLLLLCDQPPALPLIRWRSEQRLVEISQAQLALTADEWMVAGFRGGAVACDAALGWWGAQLAAQAISIDALHWNAGLAAWLDQAWFAQLAPEQQRLLGIVSLLPSVNFAEFCALTSQAGLIAQDQWQRLGECTGPLLKQGDSCCIAPYYRVYVSQAWRRHAAVNWAQALGQGVTYLLSQSDLARAAQLVLESGLAEQQDRVLQAGGWALLFSPQRSVLGQLLGQPYFNLSSEHAQQRQLLQLAWQIEVDKLPHAADSALQELLPQLTGYARAAGLALSASIGWQYDNHQRVFDDAQRALATFPGDLHPSYTLALLMLGSVLMIKGELRTAEPLLCKAQAYAARDGLGYLHLEILQRRALLTMEVGDLSNAAMLVQEVHPTAIRFGLDTAGIRDSSSRLGAWLKLQRWDITGVQTELALGSLAAEGLGERWYFPRRWYAGMLALAGGDISHASTETAWICGQLDARFYPYKWQNEAVQLQLWLAAIQKDSATLDKLVGRLADCDWQPSLHRDRRRVLHAAANLLANRSDDMKELRVLLVRLTEQGALALAQQLGLILALLCDDHTLLLEQLTRSARNQSIFDYLWLGTKSVAALQKLQRAPELAQDQQTLAFLHLCLAHLLTPRPDNDRSPDESAPPAGLTSKEWAVLKLIGQQHSNEQIAVRLFVSLATVKTHINHIYAKLGIKTRGEAIHFARSL